MELLNRIAEDTTSSPAFSRCVTSYKKHYKDAYVWTLETGCLVYTSLIIYYLTFVSSREGRTLDNVVTLLFILGALVYMTSSYVFNKLSKISDHNPVIKFLKVINKYAFMFLSFLPGIYFAFQYEEFILYFYLVIHLVTTGYFFYKRYKDFVLIQFLVGLAMSFALWSIVPAVRIFFAFFGNGWFPTTCAAVLESIIHTSVAVVFTLRLPEKYLPANMFFGLKVVKYLMFVFSWRTFFILMVIISWKNIGAGVETILEFYSNVSIIQEVNPGWAADNEIKLKPNQRNKLETN